MDRENVEVAHMGGIGLSAGPSTPGRPAMHSGNTLQGPSGPKKMSEAESEAIKLNGSIDIAWTLVNQLENKLKAVLRPSTPDAEINGEEEIVHTPLGQEFRKQTKGVNRITRCVEDIMRRLEV